MDEPLQPEVIDAEVMPAASQQATGIRLSVGFFPLGFLLFFCTPVVVINGVGQRLSWGSHYFDFQPGTYTVKAFAPYLFWPECGANSVTFDLHPEAVRTVSFYMWPWVFARGSMSVR